MRILALYINKITYNYLHHKITYNWFKSKFNERGGPETLTLTQVALALPQALCINNVVMSTILSIREIQCGHHVIT